jgi:hypothetical protein
LPGWRARLYFLLVTGSATLLLLALIYGPFWYGVEMIDLSHRTQFFTASLPAFFYTWLQPSLGQAQAAALVSRVAVSLTVLFALGQGWRAWRDHSWLSFSRSAVTTLLFYLLLTCSWFQQWYVTWPLALAVLLPPGPYLYLTLVLGGYTLLSKHIIFGPLIFRLHPFPREWREIWFPPTVLGLPWLYAFFLLVDGFFKKIISPKEPS